MTSGVLRAGDPTEGRPALVDSHVHLDRYADEAVAGMLARAAEAGVTRLLTIGVDVATSHAARVLAARWSSVQAAVGIHPTRLAGAGGADAALDALRGLLEHGPDTPAAIGEVGLDDAAPDLDEQRRFLDGCLALAGEHDLPLVLHVAGRRETHLATLEIVRQHPRVRTAAHYFVGDANVAGHYLDAGCWIAVGKPVTRPADAAVREAVPVIPPDRLLLETDTYPLTGRTTEPRDVAEVCAAVAALTGRPYEDVAASTTAAFDAFIGPYWS